MSVTIKDPKSALGAVMYMTLKHTADVLMASLDIIAEKYGIDKEEMMDVVRGDPRFTEMTTDPLLYDLLLKEAPEVAAAAAAATPAPVTKVVKKRAPKKAAAAAVAVAAPTEEPLPEPEPATAPAPVVKTFKIKPKVPKPTA